VADVETLKGYAKTLRDIAATAELSNARMRAGVVDNDLRRLAFQIEKAIPKPFPEPGIGELVRDRDGDIWRHEKEGEWVSLTIENCTFKWSDLSDTYAPLTRLVPEGIK